MYCSKTASMLLLVVFPLSLFSQTGALERRTTQVDLQNRIRMDELARRAYFHQTKPGDLYEAAARLEVEAARLKETGQDKMIERALRDHPERFQDRAVALQHILQVGVYRAMLEAAAHARSMGDRRFGYEPAVFTPGTAHLQLVGRCNEDMMRGARVAIDTVMVIGAVETLFPGAQLAGGITLLFGAILMMAMDEYC